MITRWCQTCNVWFGERGTQIKTGGGKDEMLRVLWGVSKMNRTGAEYLSRTAQVEHFRDKLVREGLDMCRRDSGYIGHVILDMKERRGTGKVHGCSEEGWGEKGGCWDRVRWRQKINGAANRRSYQIKFPCLFVLILLSFLTIIFTKQS